MKFCYHKKLLNNQKGMAIIMVLSTLLFVFLIIQETVFETRVEHAISSKELHDLQAYYMAKAGMELSLLRVRTYNKLVDLKKIPDSIRPYVDLMWRFPFQWPPLLVDTKQKTKQPVEQPVEQTIEQESLFKNGGYTTFLQSTGGLIDVNDLSSPIPQLKKWTYFILSSLITKLQEEHKSLKNLTHSDIIKLLNNISDWIDTDDMQQTESGVSSLPESVLYKAPITPLNRPLINIQELQLVSGMTQQLYQALKPFITVYGEKGLNINTLSPKLMESLHFDLNAEIVQNITNMTHKIINPIVFSWSTFIKTIESEGLEHIARDLNRVQFAKTPKWSKKAGTKKDFMNFDPPYNFNIVSIGRAGSSQKTITAVYINWKSLSKRVQKLSNKYKRSQPDTQKVSSELNNPSIIYWKVSS